MYTKIIISVFAIFLGSLSVLNIVFQPPDILISERRVRERMPVTSFQSFVSGDFMAGFEDYAADRFPFRDSFRALHAATVFFAFLQTDNDGIYFDSYGIGSFNATYAESLEIMADKISAVSDSLEGLNIFYAIVPDKSIYASRRMPGFDYALVEQVLMARLDPDKYTFISLADALDAESFYRTDLHWCQVSIGGAVNALSLAMDFEIDFNQFTKKYAGQFWGGYAGQLALPVSSESLYFLYNPHLLAFYMNMGTREFEEGPVYDLEMFNGIDPYDIFLRGAQPLVILKNENAASDRVLYIFRDSFASSLAPILASAYSKVVLVDFRFIDLRVLRQLVDFVPGSDALFLYSSGILNNLSDNPDMLMIPLP